MATSTAGRVDATEIMDSKNSLRLPTISEMDNYNCENLQDDLEAAHITGTTMEKLDVFNQSNSVVPVEQFNKDQNLQEKTNVCIKEFENKTKTYEKLLLERENDIFTLKHRINEEIEEKNILKSYYSDETVKLNNEINELEQKNKENMDRSRQIIEAKMEDIQILQEQKLSLLQSLTNEITKLNNIITKLKSDIKTEQQLKQNIKDWYEYKLMKLNEKVLNRNNELVELQDGIFGKGETIENLQLELRKERERSKKLHDDLLCMEREKQQIQNVLRMQTDEMLAMQRNYEQKIAGLLNNENIKETSESKKILPVETRKRLPLQDASNFNDTHSSYSKEQHNIQI